MISFKVAYRHLIRLRIVIVALILICFIQSNIICQNFNVQKKILHFQHLDVSDGLSQSSVHYILQDSKGFLWLCTDDGLNRYDGYDFKIYRNDPNDPNSISNNSVFTAYEDHSGFLWIGTADGLNRHNPRNGHFINYKFDPEDSISLSGNFVFSIYESTRKPGILWVGTSGGLDKLVLNDNGVPSSVIHYKYCGKEPKSISNNTITAIAEDESGRLWVGTPDGLNRFNPENENFTWYKNDSQDPNSLSDNSITCLYPDKSGALWIGTSNGLDKLIPEKMNNTSPSFLSYKNSPQNVNSLSNNHITSIFESRSRVIWIGTQNGLNRIVSNSSNRFQPVFIRYHKNIDDPNSLLDDWVHSIIEDRSGILWIGSHNGISKLSPKKNKFLLFRFQKNISSKLKNKSISAIYESSNGMLWIGSSDAGLIRFDKKNGQIIHYENDSNDPHSLSNNKIRSIIEDKSGNLWVGTIAGGGLNRFDRTNNKFIHYLYDPLNPSTISSNIVLVLYKDRDENIWVGTFGGLNMFDIKNNQFIRYLNDPADTNSLCDNNVRAICEDKFGDLWVGTNNGLDKFDKKTKKFIHYKVNPKNPNSLNNKIIFSLYGDKIGNLWIGTDGSGLNKLEIEKGKFSSYGVDEGLPNEVVYGILEDDLNNLWLSTNKGLSKFNPRTETFDNFDVSDGLLGNEFNVGAAYKSDGGELFFGGVYGFVAFYPDNIKQSTFVPQVVITSFFKFNNEVHLDKPISEIDQLELSYKDYMFSFEFASLDFQAPEKNKYAYKMEGLDETWTYTTAEKRFATYTTLPAGEYVFRVKGTNSDGIWNENGTSIKIIITPPLWQTWWFRTLLIIILIASLVIIYKYRVKRIEEKKKMLELQVKERTEAAQKIQEAFSEVEKLKNQLQEENIYLKDEIKLTHNFENIISTSESFKKILYRIEQVSSIDTTVLIMGESGTGKELLARAIHSLSNRKDKPLIKVNCATLPANLIESELFGHEKGSFTGAFVRKIGKFEIANGGTIFLDEIGELPIELQTKLLRVLQESEFDRLGGSNLVKVDVRVIAATNRDLETALKQGKFREDLYYRLNVFPIKVPPLRDRKEDIPVLVNHFIKKHCKKVGKSIESISPGLMNKLIEYNWPGNVRELENLIERAIIISPGNSLIVEDSLIKPNEHRSTNGYQPLKEIERNYIIEVLNSTNWRVSGPKGAAKILGLVPSTLEYRMKKLNIQRL